ncbi:unnamed protein product, partial [Scytosiphon promiscuus]
RRPRPWRLRRRRPMRLRRRRERRGKRGVRRPPGRSARGGRRACAWWWSSWAAWRTCLGRCWSVPRGRRRSRTIKNACTRRSCAGPGSFPFGGRPSGSSWFLAAPEPLRPKRRRRETLLSASTPPPPPQLALPRRRRRPHRA